MNEFEKELRFALRRPEAPAGFVSRVVAQAKPKAARRWPAWIAAGVAAGLILSASGFEYRQYRARKASRELITALEIAGAKLNMTQQKISELNRRTINE